MARSAVFLLDLSPTTEEEVQNVISYVVSGLNTLVSQHIGKDNTNFQIKPADVKIISIPAGDVEKPCAVVISNTSNPSINCGLLVDLISNGGIVSVPVQIANYVGQPMSLVRLQLYLRRDFLDIRRPWLLWGSILVLLVVNILGCVFAVNMVMFYVFVALSVLVAIFLFAISIPAEFRVLSKNRQRFSSIGATRLHITKFDNYGTQTTTTVDPRITHGGLLV
jgi:hypothetical protein